MSPLALPTVFEQEGKTKLLKAIPEAPEELLVTFKDSATAFNALKVAQYAGKGSLNAQISACLFAGLETLGIPTCYLGKGPETNQLRYRHLSMIPIEVIVRNQAFGGFCKRYPLTPQGTRFPSPVVEFFWKDDAAGDPLLSEAAVAALNLLPHSVSLQTLRNQALTLNEIFLALFQQVGIDCADFKLEFGLDSSGALRLADELSPDGFRLRDSQTGQVLDKDVFRQDLAELLPTYQQVWQRLQAASWEEAVLFPSSPLQTYQAELRVFPSPHILSPETRTIEQGLQTLGFSSVQEVRSQKRFLVTLKATHRLQAQQQFEKMALEFLSNPVIESYQLETLEVLSPDTKKGNA
jgi:phosphoribosylaminoimidazole-succinocarboxamide synthase